MKLYYSYIDEYYNNDENSSLSKHEKEHILGRKIVLDISKSIYGIDDEIVYDGKRPYFKDNEVYFSISHSENLVVVAFDKYPIGVDVEYIQQRNFEKLARRYDIRVDEPKDFYEWWTAYEAKYKNQTAKNIKTFEIVPEYICSVSYLYSETFTGFEILEYCPQIS